MRSLGLGGGQEHSRPNRMQRAQQGRSSWHLTLLDRQLLQPFRLSKMSMLILEMTRYLEEPRVLDQRKEAC